uniref:Acid-sensing ion channel 1 n=1 Tax=Sinocyclocheilus anshuiensis TaxID=1608454 RepID=A0A671QQY2_9TELE
MCPGDAAPKQRTEGSLKEAGKLFLKHTTFHGLRHVFLSGSYPRRVAWLLAFLTALALLFTWSSNRVRYLLSSPVYTKAHMVYAKRLLFPAVTICNQNILLPRRMKKPDLFSAGRWLGLFGKNWQVSPAVREALTSHVDGTNNEPPWSPFSRILDFNHFLPPPRDSQPSMRHLLDRLGHQLEEMLLYCRFQGQLCGPRNFSTIFTRYGKCYTFNSGQDGRPLLITMKGGMGNGLELMLDIQQDEYLPLTYLPPPWGDCKATPMDSDFFNTYSITACRIDCETRYLVENCNCRMVHMPGDAPYCTPEQYKECADPALDFLVERDNDYCVCDTPCNMTRYGKELSFVKIPSKASAKYLAKKYNKTEQYIAENILVLDIFFEALNFETIEQKKAYELAGLLGDIGGQMGLFIGASILTILELFDYLYEVIKYKLCHCAKKKHQRSNNNERGAVLSLDDVKRHAPCENLRTPSTYPANMLPHHPGQGNFEDFTC